MAEKLFPTTVVGSYPQPDWLIDRELLKKTVPRIRVPEVWRVAAEYLEQAQDDATLLAIREMERAGVDIITDGEMRRESYSNRLATEFEGIDCDNPATVIGRLGKPVTVPRVVGRIARSAPIERRDVEFLVRNTDRQTKITLPGPFTMGLQAKDDFYGDMEALSMDLAAAVNEEIADLKRAGVDVVQLDEPWLQSFPEEAARYGVKVINRALEDISGPTVLHICFGYAHFVSEKKGTYNGLGQFADSVAGQISIETAQPDLDLGVLKEISNKKVVLGVLNLGTSSIETGEEVAERIRQALKFLGPDQIIPAPDCGMKYLDRDVAFGKLKAMADGAQIVREELAGKGD
jgi:5-methyltetrahydropteroyltriglutamate--homocysteine methyltransferase